MAEYIDIDAPIDVAVYQRNRRIQVTLRQILESNDAKYQAADVRPVVRGKWVSHDKGWWRLRNGSIATDWHSFLLSAETFKEVCDIDSTFSKAETEWKPDYECSVCGSRSWEDEYDFCPNCGADMREEPPKEET